MWPMLANELECAWAYFELQAKQMKNVSFGRDSLKNEFIKLSSSDPNAPNSN